MLPQRLMELSCQNAIIRTYRFTHLIFQTKLILKKKSFILKHYLHHALVDVQGFNMTDSNSFGDDGISTQQMGLKCHWNTTNDNNNY